MRQLAVTALGGRRGAGEAGHAGELVVDFFGLWAYPHQLGAWALVHLSKWSAWSLLVLMNSTIVTHLKHIKATVHVPP